MDHLFWGPTRSVTPEYFCPSSLSVWGHIYCWHIFFNGRRKFMLFQIFIRRKRTDPIYKENRAKNHITSETVQLGSYHYHPSRLGFIQPYNFTQSDWDSDTSQLITTYA